MCQSGEIDLIQFWQLSSKIFSEFQAPQGSWLCITPLKRVFSSWQLLLTQWKWHPYYLPRVLTQEIGTTSGFGTKWQGLKFFLNLTDSQAVHFLVHKMRILLLTWWGSIEMNNINRGQQNKGWWLLLARYNSEPPGEILKTMSSGSYP